MESLSLETRMWAQEQFGKCELADKRRSKRLAKTAAKVAANPSASFPEQMGSWADLKAAYRMFDTEAVTFQAVVQPHWEQTRARSSGRYLVLGDTTEVDFGIQREIPDLSSTGNGGGYGFLLHSGLMVGADDERIIGLSGQQIHYRKAAPPGDTSARRLKRERESEIWGKVIDQTGPPGQGVQLIHTLDRGADNFEVFCHAREQRTDWVVRVCQLKRKIISPWGKKKRLRSYLRTLAVAGTYELELRARKNQAARTARLEVCYGPLQMPPPTHQSPYVKRQNPGLIPMWVVWVREVNAPRGVPPIEWVLYTSLPAESFEHAWKVIEYYEKRWLIEEWHKALKTGCRITERQLKTKERLEAMLGLMSVVAVRLLQLKSVARSDPERPAKEVVPALWVAMLVVTRKLRGRRNLTVGQFYRELAKLGGFLGRKHDGEPGWITIWRGWEKLHTMIRGAELAAELRKELKKCG
jgi:hypothetical protein